MGEVQSTFQQKWDSQIHFWSITSRMHLLAWQRMQHRKSDPRQTERYLCRAECISPNWAEEKLSFPVKCRCFLRLRGCLTFVCSRRLDEGNDTPRSSALWSSWVKHNKLKRIFFHQQSCSAGKSRHVSAGFPGLMNVFCLKQRAGTRLHPSLFVDTYPSSMYHYFNWEEQTKGLNILWWLEC